MHLKCWACLQPVSHAVTVLLQTGVQQTHPLLQTLQSVLHQSLILSSTQPPCCSTQQVTTQVHLPGHLFQLFVETLKERVDDSKQESTKTNKLKMRVMVFPLLTSKLVSCVSVSSSSSTGPDSSWFSAASSHEEAAETAANKSCCRVSTPRDTAALVSPSTTWEENRDETDLM